MAGTPRLHESGRLHVVDCPHDYAEYCGPVAVSIVSGCTVSAAEQAIRDYSGWRRTMAVRATAGSQIAAALGIMGYAYVPTMSYDWLKIDGRKRPTVTQVAADLRCDHGLWIIGAGGHWIVYDSEAELFACALNRQPIPIAGSDMARKRVFSAAWVTQMPFQTALPESTE